MFTLATPQSEPSCDKNFLFHDISENIAEDNPEEHHLKSKLLVNRSFHDV
jgi:hypothetical protein